ncbi:MAG: hypothetical protein AAFV07_03970 [Bacteroidota bacterium]
MRSGLRFIIWGLLSLPLMLVAQPDTISGIINQYTRITAIDAVNGVLTVDDPGLFALDDKVLIYQTQGAVINETQAAQFGLVSNINGAGLYEFATVCISDPGSGEISIQETLSNTYNPNAVSQSGLQLIRVPVYAGDVVVEATLTAQAWNGQTGGVLAFEAAGTVKLDADIDVSGAGFRGAEAINSTYSCISWFNGTAAAQNSTLFYYTLASGEGGLKGEGIAAFIPNKTCGQGRQANGGGGGNDHNAGGGGGGNFNDGGQGGERDNSFFNCYGVFPGRGGGALSAFAYNNAVGQNRAFLGGGGGAGHAQDNEAADGGDGGGLIMIKAASFNGNNQQIMARGISANDSLSDGGSGGGAGGAILIEAGFFTADPFTVDLRGGDGGNSAINCEGPGGGGAGGVIWTSVALDPGVTTVLNGGTSGVAVACSNDPQNAANGSNGATITGLTLTQSGGTPNCVLSNDPFPLTGAPHASALTLSWILPADVPFSTLELIYTNQQSDPSYTALVPDQQNWTGPLRPGQYQVRGKDVAGYQYLSEQWNWEANSLSTFTLLNHPWSAARDWSIEISSENPGNWTFRLMDLKGRAIQDWRFQQTAGIFPANLENEPFLKKYARSD